MSINIQVGIRNVRDKIPHGFTSFKISQLLEPSYYFRLICAYGLICNLNHQK